MNNKKNEVFENEVPNSSGKAERRAKGKRRRFNFIDLLIILAVILLGAIIINMFFPSSMWRDLRDNDERMIQYTVEFIGVDEKFVDNIKENDAVIDSVSKYALGTVITADYTNHTELNYNAAANQGMLSVYEGKYNILVTVMVTAEYNEGEGYSVGDRRIAVGELLSLRFPDYADEGYCVSLSEAD